ncbi:MAG: transporter substrate-binding domain-containing protein [Deltaproteobacteria bacterium]|nr:transporter substrate-binding domain-containing protein [Deltaproteobacteria bacterium]
MINNKNREFYAGFFLGTFITLFLLFYGIRSASADTPVVTIGVYENAPKVFTSESGKPVGIFIDLIEYIAKREGWSLRYSRGTWGEGLDCLEKGEIDLMPDVAYTAEREKTFDFHKVPALSSWFQVYAGKGSGIKSILDLAGKRITVLERSVQEEAFSRLSAGFGLNATLISLPDYKTLFERVASGEADAAITNRFYGVMHSKKFGLEDTAVIFNPSNLFFAAPEGKNERLLNAIDAHLIELKKDTQSIYYQSLKRWTSEEVRFKFPVWVEVFALVAGVVLLMSLAGSVILKRQVDARTRELREINQEIEQRIDERTAELAVATEKAQAADRIKSAFLATMSHELRTPLNSIIGFTGILLQGLAGPMNEEQQKQLTMVQNSSRHLLALINDVLDISKIEAGQLSLSFSSFDLRPSIENMIKLVTPLAEKKGLDLEMDLSDGIGTVTTDQRRLEQVILNLLNNAVKFTEKGHVHILCRTDNDHYLLSVSDTGIGMRPEDLPGLFKPFHQIDTGLSRKHEGTGLGLSICKKLMDMMGGTIDVKSRLDHGSTFTIRFPQQMQTGDLS